MAGLPSGAMDRAWGTEKGQIETGNTADGGSNPDEGTLHNQTQNSSDQTPIQITCTEHSIKKSTCPLSRHKDVSKSCIYDSIPIPLTVQLIFANLRI